MQSIWPRFQLSSVHYCSSESQTLHPEAVSKSHRGRWGAFKHTQTRTCTRMHTRKHFLSTSHTITHAHNLSLFLSFFQPFFLSLTHTHSLTSPGIRSFYRAAMCWRGRWYGRAVSPSSDWISDQYPVPRRPASLGRTDCL